MIFAAWAGPGRPGAVGANVQPCPDSARPSQNVPIAQGLPDLSGAELMAKRPTWRRSKANIRLPAADRSQSLNVIGTLAHRVPYRIGSAANSIGRTCRWLQISQFWPLAGMADLAVPYRLRSVESVESLTSS